MHRLRRISTVVVGVITTAFWTLRASADKVRGSAFVCHAGSRNGVAPAVNLDLVDGHGVWIHGVDFEVMF